MLSLKKFFHDWFHLQDIIMFESVPDFGDSPIYVFNELVKRGYDKKYKFVWSCHNENSRYDKCPNTCKIGTFKNFYYRKTAKYIIMNNQMYRFGIRRKQKMIYIAHGEPAKSIRKYYYMKGRTNGIINISPSLEANSAHEFRCKKELVHGLGFPRNDRIINSRVDLHKIFNFKGKIIFYYPTIKIWRHGGHLNHGDACVSSLLKNNSDYDQINSFLSKKHALLVIKLHWESGGREILKAKYSNILFVDEDFFMKNKIASYQCLAKCDALLTDYSSVFYDYLIVNKPIGFIWTDFKQYSRRPGLVDIFVNNISQCGFKIYTMDELKRFISDLCSNIDLNKQNRTKIRSLIYPYKEISATKRVTDFIIKTFDLKL